MKVIDMIILCAVVAAAALAFRYIRRSAAKGGCCGCSGCSQKNGCTHQINADSVHDIHDSGYDKAHKIESGQEKTDEQKGKNLDNRIAGLPADCCSGHSRL